MKVVMIVQARMTSTRLPGKVLKSVLDKPLLEYQIERLQRVNNADELVIATTVNTADDAIVTLCETLNVSHYRGSEQDVLSRYYNAAQQYAADVVVRLTSDCPLIDPKVVEKIIQTYLDSHPQYDYVSNSIDRTYPRGMDAEVFSSAVLREACEKATVQPDREHVTPWIYLRPDIYRLGHVRYMKNQAHHRWTVDTSEDLLLVRQILETLYPQKSRFTLEDCLALLEKNPEWQEINTNIAQKQYGEA